MANYIGDDNDNTITGSSSSDTIIGRGGNDTLTGGAGNDVFAYDTRGFGADTITDFNTSGDRIDLAYLHVADLDSLRPFMAQDGLDVVITFGWDGYSESIRLKNVSIGSLDASDFTFNTSTAPLVVNGSSYIYGDVLFGGSGNDTVSGFDGDDILVGGAGDDWLIGGAGADYLSYAMVIEESGYEGEDE
jgi:Ca2+-binding RTX toxin-like protein